MRLCTVFVCILAFFLALGLNDLFKILNNPTQNLIVCYLFTMTVCLVFVHKFVEEKFRRIQIFFDSQS